MISGHGTIETAVRATKLGAYDFLEKPLSLEKTLILVKNAIESKKLQRENVDLKKQLQVKSIIVGDSIPMKALRQQIGLMAPTNGRVLIYGESGTGKELVAHAIHGQSLRKDETFVEVNCAAIPEDLIESELFGHCKGSFPGAAADKEGKFQRAHGGTLFLDEVGDMSLKTQSKVLRTLEEQRFTPVGSDETITVDVRVIASTNKDLDEEISRGNFREDLFYRLNVIPFFVPPLRERKEDIPLFTRHFLKELAATYGRRPREISDDAIEILMRYSWPGNVRELRNVIERIVIMNPTTTRFDSKHLPPLVYREGSRRAPKSEFSTLHQARDAYERDYILKTLDQNHGNVTPHGGSAGPGAQPSLPEDEGSGDRGERIKSSHGVRLPGLTSSLFGTSGSRELRPEAAFHRRFSASNSSSVRGQSDPNSRDRLRSARTFPPVWQRAQ